jgi:hypothetical protein
MGFHPLAIRYLWERSHAERSEGSHPSWLITQSRSDAQGAMLRSLPVCDGSGGPRAYALSGSRRPLQFEKGPQTVQEGGLVFALFSIVLAVGSRLFQ